MARLQAVIVFPTPPLPELTAIDFEITRRSESPERAARISNARSRETVPEVPSPMCDRAISAHVERGRRRAALPLPLEARIVFLSVEKMEKELEVFLLDLQKEQ